VDRGLLVVPPFNPDRCDKEESDIALSAGEAAVVCELLFAFAALTFAMLAAAVRTLSAGDGTETDKIDACGD
jgi:hypothetical protein